MDISPRKTMVSLAKKTAFCPGFIIILLIIAAIASIVVNATNEGSRLGTRKLGLIGVMNLGFNVHLYKNYIQL